jgi:hypothetical protein
MALRPCASAAECPYHWFMKQLSFFMLASVLETTLESRMGIVAANIYYPAQASTRSPALLCGWFCHCVRPRIPLSLSSTTCYFAEKNFFSGWQDMEVEFLIGSRETRTFIPCTRCTKWRGHGAIGGYPTGAVALAGGRSSLIPHPIPSQPFPSLSSFPFQFYFWDHATERDLTSVSHLLDALEPDDCTESGEMRVPDFFFGSSCRPQGAVTFKVGRGRSTIRIF